MIPVRKGDSPAILESERCRNQVEQNIQIQRFEGEFYNDNQVRRALCEAFYEKCAYCESQIRPVATPQVEHYRPKGRVTEDSNHPGYYWLGHEWNNLLLACPTCNNKKRNKFPILGSYVRSPLLNDQGRFDRSCTHPQVSPLADEQPLLLRPDEEGFRPQNHLRFEPDGSVAGLSPQGRETIEITGLLRDDLVIKRKKIIDEQSSCLTLFIEAFEKNEIDEDGLRFFLRRWRDQLFDQAKSPSEYAYIQLRRQALIRFEAFYLTALPEQVRPLLEDLFEEDQIFDRPLWWTQGRASLI